MITLLGAILFSTKAIIVKKAFNHTHIDALTLLTLRMIFSLPFYVAAALITTSDKERTMLSRKQWLYIIVKNLKKGK